MSNRAKRITIGWAKWLGIIELSDEDRKESERRLKICDTCIFSKESKFLEFLNNSANDVDGKYCTKCKCPCHQKSIVKKEKCPEDFW